MDISCDYFYNILFGDSPQSVLHHGLTVLCCLLQTEAQLIASSKDKSELSEASQRRRPTLLPALLAAHSLRIVMASFHGFAFCEP